MMVRLCFSQLKIYKYYSKVRYRIEGCMILDTEVDIVLTPRYVSYWEDKGYNIPRKRDKWGRTRFKKGSTIKVKVEDLSYKSHVLVSCKCKICGNVRKTEYFQYREICGDCNRGIRSGESHPQYGKKMTEEQLRKSRDAKIEKGIWVSEEQIDDFSLYRRKVKNETNKWKSLLFDSWDGRDYYTGGVLVTNEEYKLNNPNTHVNRNKLQPTVDHKISVFVGFMNDIDHKIIGNIDNLCVCAKITNSTKSSLSEEQYKIKNNS